ncbi:MAG: DUF5693 family protein [Syntrophomonadaceae bacterium]
MPESIHGKSTRWLWVLLALTLILSYGGVQLRTTNEAQNKNVVTTIDYREFERSANSANLDMDNVLARLQEKGVSSVAVSEITLRDLAYNGDVMVSSYGDFSALNAAISPQVRHAAERAIGSRYISPSNLVVVASNPAMADFLQQRLTVRFLPNELITFQLGDNYYFIINAELGTIYVEPSPADKNKPVSRDLDARLGFDETLLANLKNKGFDIILRPGSNMGTNIHYRAEYDRLVSEYGVKYVIFGGNDLYGAAKNVDWIGEWVERNHLTIGIIEASNQLQYYKQAGLEEVMASAAYPINRVYSTTNDEFVTSVDERYYRWVRGVIDRGIRIMYVVPFKDTKLSFSRNLNDTIDTIGRFHATISGKGFAIDQPLNDLSNQMTSPFHRLMVSLSLLLGGTIYLLWLFRPRIQAAWLAAWLITAGLACLGLNILLPADFSKLYALGGAILYPSLSSLMLLIYLKDNRGKPYLQQLLFSLAIILGINGLGMYTAVTSLADIRYIMNVLIFSGVKLSFLAPLLLFPINYVGVMVGFGSFKDKAIRFLLDRPNYLVLVLLMVGGAAGYYYIGRSGNAMVSVSGLEIRTREVLESVFLARPRFKELLIGYPALMVMIYWYKKYRQDLILLVLGLGVMMGSISMVNSFCHVFTAVMVSVNRTLGGLLTGLLVGAAVLLCIKIGELIYAKLSVHSWMTTRTD